MERLDNHDYRPTRKIAQIRSEIEELDHLTNRKLYPAEEN